MCIGVGMNKTESGMPDSLQTNQLYLIACRSYELRVSEP